MVSGGWEIVMESWIERVGLAGFIFFLVKGLLWLAVPLALAMWR